MAFPKSNPLTLLLALMVIFAAACGGDGTRETNGEDNGASGDSSAQTTMEETTMEETTSSTDLSQLEVGPEEISNMMPAEGIEKAEARPLPEDPPEGIRVYDATTNELVENVEYDRAPPTNGDHDPAWQNCGFYDEPIDDATAVHSLDHGVVWITYRPDLPADEIETLREYGTEEYVIVSPYPEQESPVITTSWRIQLELEGAEDPRLRQFVDDFRISEIAPLAGNGCIRGVGEPVVS
ncbi:MAG: DUF3105 domain-containing protein [Rubrobacteraceae bacterium]